MKTNLDSLYKTNKEDEKKGIWFMIGAEDGPGFLLKRFGGHNSVEIKKLMNTKFKPYARQIEKKTLSDEKEKSIMTELFIECALLDWKNIEVNGEKDIPFTKDVALELLIGLPELVEELTAYSSDADNYREDLGNS